MYNEARFNELFDKKQKARFFGGNPLSKEEMIELSTLIHEGIHRDIKNYWDSHKEVLEELPVADLNGAKLYADIFGYKYEVKTGDGAVYYKNANDVGSFNNHLSEKWAVAVPKKNGFNLIIYKVVEC